MQKLQVVMLARLLMEMDPWQLLYAVQTCSLAPGTILVLYIMRILKFNQISFQ